MSEQTNPDDTRRERLDEVIGAFLVGDDAGENPSPADWLARIPALPELLQFLRPGRMDALVEPLRMAPEQTTDFEIITV